MSNGAAQAAAGATYRMLRELGSRAQPSYAAIREPSDLVVAQRFVRAGAGASNAKDELDDATPLDAEAMALLLRDARCLAKNWHPNIARVRHVDLISKPRSLLVIASDLLEGSTLADLIEAAEPERTREHDPPLALPVLVRILLDVLGGLHALHGLRDGMNVALGAIHGELCPANVVVAKDGVARIVNVLRKRPVRIKYGSEAVGYAAPEALDAGGTADPRSDVYAVGVMLWEGLAGRRLYKETAPARLLVRQREGELAPPPIHPSSPFARLADVALRALSFDPSLRYRGATEMATDLRKIAGLKLATGAAVAARVADLAGDRIRMRRGILEPAMSGTRRRASESSMAAAEENRETARHPAITDEQIALAKGIDAGAAVLVPAPSPLLDIESTEQMIVAALATTTAQMRAVAVERALSTPALPATSTPGDFVIPIEVTETWNESAPRPRRRFAAIALLAMLVLLAMGALVAMRGRSTATGATPMPAAASPPGPAAPAPSGQAGADANAAQRASASAIGTLGMPMTPSSANARAAPRMAVPPAPPPSAKPKKSIYEPDGL
jgi:hypothetical protein